MARIHQAIILVIFACFSGSISKRHHHHRFHHSLLHGMKGLNLGEHMQFFTNESDYKVREAYLGLPNVGQHCVEP